MNRNPKRMLILGIVLGLCATASATDWAELRGPLGTGHSPETGVFQGKQNIALKVNWAVEAGSAYAGLAIRDGRLITGYSDGTNDHLAAYDANTGKQLWSTAIDATYVGHDGSHDGIIATPAISETHTYILSPRGLLVALDVKTGKETWKVNLAEKYEIKKPHYGFGASPILMDGVLVMLGGGDNQAVLGLDPATGEKLWAAGSDGVQYQSPIPYTADGQTMVLAATNKKVIAVNPKDGKELWSFEHGGDGARGAASLSPIPAGPNRLFLSNKDNSSTMFTKADGAYTQTWESRHIRNSYNVPVYHEGHVYAYSSRILTCLDAGTGEPKWRSRQPGDGFLILVDGHLVLLTKDGTLHIAPAKSDGYNEIASVKAFDPLAWSHPIFSDGSIYVRGLKHIARVDVTRAVSVASNEAGGPAGNDAFSKLLDKLETASNKDALIDAFMKANPKMPITLDDGTLHFVYRGEANDMAVGGDIFGARQERPMHRVKGTDLFYYTTKIEADAMVSYVFIKDYKDMIRDPLNPNETTTNLLGDDMDFNRTGADYPRSWLAMPKWKEPAYAKAAPDGKRGKVETHSFKTKLQEEGEFKLSVYLPNGYSDSGSYPTAYVHGGPAPHAKGGWINALDNLIGNKVAPVIVVFVDAAPRSREFNKMFVEEVVPTIDGKYATDKRPEARANIGIGFAGDSAIGLTLSHPDLFLKVGTHSSLLFSAGDLAGILKGHSNLKGLYLYHDYGKYDIRNPQEAWSVPDFHAQWKASVDEHSVASKFRQINQGSDWISWRTRTADLMSSLFPMSSSVGRTSSGK